MTREAKEAYQKKKACAASTYGGAAQASHARRAARVLGKETAAETEATRDAEITAAARAADLHRRRLTRRFRL